jgi:hypothetical protein
MTIGLPRLLSAYVWGHYSAGWCFYTEATQLISDQLPRGRQQEPNEHPGLIRFAVAVWMVLFAIAFLGSLVRTSWGKKKEAWVRG